MVASSSSSSSSSSSTQARIRLWSWLRYVFVSRPSPFERRWSGNDYERQRLRSLLIGLLTWTSEVNSIKSLCELILLCSQKSLSLVNQFIEIVRVAWQARILSVYRKTKVLQPSEFTLGSGCRSIPVRRCSRSPIAVVKYYRSQRGSGHTDPPRRSCIQPEVPLRPCPNVQTVFGHL